MLTIQPNDEIVKVKTILEEDDDRFDHLVGLLEKWMNCHAFLPKDYDKPMLPIFLRNCKYSLDKTKRKLELYFVYKKRYPELFCFNEFNDETEIKSLNNFYVFESSKLTPEGYRVAFGGFRSPNTTGCDMNAVNKILAMYGTYRSNVDVIHCGGIGVINLQNLSPSIVSGVMNPFLRKQLETLQIVNPFRVRYIYVTFLPGFAVPFVNMIKMMFNDKIRNVVHMETGNEEMKKNIPLDCLPKEFGGTDGTINENAAKFMQDITQKKHWFLEHEKINIVGDFSKDQTRECAENFGTQGSFRKLNID